jgi:hypothetical protein
MPCDINRINSIEHNLKNNPKMMSTTDLLYYLECNTNNKNVNSEEYFKKINSSFFFEDIFVNTSNYSSILPCIIGLVIPFYFMYPKFYKLGNIGLIIGLISFIVLYSKVDNLFSNFFNNIGIYFCLTSIIFYVVFFICLNKLNHVSLFFISAIVAYLVINYVCRIILTFPIEQNPYNKFRATENNNTNFTPYNLLLETTCYEIIKRYNLKIPTGVMLYSYLTKFEINANNTNKYADFFTNFLGPFFSIGILWILGYFLSMIHDKVSGLDDSIDILPIIGINENSFKYYTCQANYILPKQFNIDLIIHEILDKYNFDTTIYRRIEKGLVRISNEMLEKYNPKFISENISKSDILKNLNENKIFIQIKEIIDKYDKDFDTLKFDTNFDTQIRDFLKINFRVPYKEKKIIYSMLYQINNVLKIDDNFNELYKNESDLAIEDLLYDKKLKVGAVKLIKKIADEYKDTFFKNINIKTLYGYDDNIITYELFNDNVKKSSNIIFKYLLRLISCWLLFSKPIGSSWLLSKYMLIPKYGFKSIFKNISDDSFLWKYFSMGLDTSYLKDIYKKIGSVNTLPITTRIVDIILSVLVFIIVFGILQFYNSTNFGFNLSPSWYNLIFQFIFFMNIVGNIICYSKKKSNIWYNIIFLTVIIVFVVIAIILMIFLKK